MTHKTVLAAVLLAVVLIGAVVAIVLAVADPGDHRDVHIDRDKIERSVG